MLRETDQYEIAILVEGEQNCTSHASGSCQSYDCARHIFIPTSFPPFWSIESRSLTQRRRRLGGYLQGSEIVADRRQEIPYLAMPRLITVSCRSLVYPFKSVIFYFCGPSKPRISSDGDIAAVNSPDLVRFDLCRRAIFLTSSTFYRQAT